MKKQVFCYMLLFLILNVINYVHGQADGQKAHFQVHNKEQGKLEIHATKSKASITVSADSVQLVVDPGTEEVPDEDVTAQTQKVNTINGNSRSIKRNILPRNPQKTIRLTKLDVKGKKRSKGAKGHPLKTHDINASKKSNVADKEMRVHGQSGALRVHSDHNITTLDSQSGKLEIYIKNPEHDTEKENTELIPDLHVDIHTEEAYKKTHLSDKPKLLHILKDVVGLKKSIVNTNNKNVARNLKNNKNNSQIKHRPCVVPPCSV